MVAFTFIILQKFWEYFVFSLKCFNHYYKIIQLDSTCVLIDQQLCFHSAMKHENDVSDMVGCLQVVRIYSFMKDIKVHVCVRTSDIVFLFVKMEIKEHVLFLN